MNTISSLLEWIGNTIGDNPSNLKTTTKTLVGGINGTWEIVYPIGSYYETSDTAFNPNTAWGGSWELETAGQTHVSAGTGYTVAGALTNTTDGGSPYIQAHTHAHTNPTIASNGSHTHYLYLRNAGEGSPRATNNVTYGKDGYDYYRPNPMGAAGAHSHSVSGGGVGAVTGATTGNAGNMPPYIIVNRWHRTA